MRGAGLDGGWDWGLEAAWVGLGRRVLNHRAYRNASSRGRSVAIPSSAATTPPPPATAAAAAASAAATLEGAATDRAEEAAFKSAAINTADPAARRGSSRPEWQQTRVVEGAGGGKGVGGADGSGRGPEGFSES